MAEGEGFEPPVRFPNSGFQVHRRVLIGYEKFFTLLYFSTAYKPSVLIGYDWIGTVLSMKLLQFYYSR
jgi:hypothetical protein